MATFSKMFVRIGDAADKLVREMTICKLKFMGKRAKLVALFVLIFAMIYDMILPN